MKKLTDRQEQVLHFIAAFLGQHHYPPTIREIAKNFEISVKGAYDHVKALEKKEKIICNMNRSRAIEIVGQSDGRGEEEFVSIPVLGNVAAGTPLFAEENLDGTIKLPVTMLKSGPHFALRVKGDSMQDAGIMSGDIAVFRQQNIADKVAVLRLGHRPGRDDRMTTHIGLTARALGADRVVLVGGTTGPAETVRTVTDRFGGPF
ncbi:MAG: transcriptional repressor LexA, partial [Spirochaetota bacterium]